MSKTTTDVVISPFLRRECHRVPKNKDQTQIGIFVLNLTMVVLFLLLAIIPSELYVFGHIFGRSKSYRKALPSRCSSQLELSGTLSPISWLFYSGGGEKIHFQAQSACNQLF